MAAGTPQPLRSVGQQHSRCLQLTCCHHLVNCGEGPPPTPSPQADNTCVNSAQLGGEFTVNTWNWTGSCSLCQGAKSTGLVAYQDIIGLRLRPQPTVTLIFC